MDDSLQVILYIVVLAIYILSRALKSKNKSAPRKSDQEFTDDRETEAPAMTFEDLVREITTGQRSRPQKPIKKTSPKKPVKREYEFKGDYPDDDEIQEVYEESVRKAQKFKTLDEMVDLKEPVLKFKEYEETDEHAGENSLASEIRSMLRNPEDARKAIILKEILDRKF